MNFLASDVLEVHHRRSQVAVPEPLLQSPNADAFLKTSCREGVPEFMQEPLSAVWSLTALIAVLRSATSAIEPGAAGDSLQFVLELLVRFAFGSWEDQVVSV